MNHAVFCSVSDYCRHGPYKSYAHECRSAGRTPVDLIRVSQPAGSFPDPPIPALSVFMVVRGVIQTRCCLGEKPFTRVQRPGTFVVAPPNVACDYEVDASHELLVVALPCAAVTPLVEAAGTTLTDLGSLHADVHRDPFVEQLCHRLFEEAANDSPLGGLFADHAVVTLASALMRLAGRRATARQHERPLLRATLRRVLDYLSDHLTESVSLAELAAVARLSEFHFARLFKQTVGEPPYAYVIRQRIELAKRLIREGRRY